MQRCNTPTATGAQCECTDRRELWSMNGNSRKPRRFGDTFRAHEGLNVRALIKYKYQWVSKIFGGKRRVLNGANAGESSGFANLWYFCALDIAMGDRRTRNGSKTVEMLANTVSISGKGWPLSQIIQLFAVPPGVLGTGCAPVDYALCCGSVVAYGDRTSSYGDRTSSWYEQECQCPGTGPVGTSFTVLAEQGFQKPVYLSHLTIPKCCDTRYRVPGYRDRDTRVLVYPGSCLLDRYKSDYK
eukprot:2079338-Rhodomonas_salina.3